MTLSGLMLESLFIYGGQIKRLNAETEVAFLSCKKGFLGRALMGARIALKV